MGIQVADYVIGQDEKGRKYLAQVVKIRGDKVHVALDKDRAYKPQNAMFETSQIVAVLGHEPAHGTAYGCKVEPYRSTLVHPEWGNVHLFVKKTKADLKALRTGFDRVAAKLKRHGIFGFVAQGALETEVRPPSGKYSGMYKFSNKGGEPQDRMLLKPTPESAFDRVIAHEAGHGVWFRLLNAKLQARWVNLYHSYMKLKQFEPHAIRKLRDQYIEDSLPVAEFRSGLDEDASAMFDLLIGSVSSTTRLANKHLDLLAANGDLGVIHDSWPLHLEDSDHEIVVSEYASTSPEEFFAEAFCNWLLGVKLPKRVTKAIEKTVSAVGGRS